MTNIGNSAAGISGIIATTLVFPFIVVALDMEWGDKNNYEISIDTSKLGVEGSIDVLESYIRKRIFEK